MNADGSNPSPLTDKIIGKGENSHRWPVFLPDGEQFPFGAGGRMRIVVAIHPPDAIRKTLDCLGLPSRPPPIARASHDRDVDGV